MIRAWKDADFRASLDSAEQASLASPAGAIELADADLGDAAGGEEALTQTSICATSWPCAIAGTIAISKNISCGACDTTLWSGSCAVSSIGCCPAF
jgi:mersacidin/lichenicidin family type 2 lantibiotic